MFILGWNMPLSAFAVINTPSFGVQALVLQSIQFNVAHLVREMEVKHVAVVIGK
jgi:hypothetical protein